MPRALGLCPLRLLTAGLALMLSPGCRTPADNACLSTFESAQEVVMAVQGEKIDSLDASLAAVRGAIATCEAAGRSGEVAELQKAESKLASHRDIVERQRALREARREKSPEELARLEKSGDPGCPSGQAYLHAKSGKRIRCTGPQPALMPWTDAREYYRRRGYKIREQSEPPALRFEYGAETLVFEYDSRESGNPARCVTLYPPPDRSWQEATAQITGSSPGRLRSGTPVRLAGNPQPLRVEESETKVVVRIGTCASN